MDVRRFLRLSAAGLAGLLALACARGRETGNTPPVLAFDAAAGAPALVVAWGTAAAEPTRFRWRSLGAADGAAAGFGAWTDGSARAAATRHLARLPAAARGRALEYEVATAAGRWVRTVPPEAPPGSWRFTVYGDVQDNPAVHVRVLGAMAAERPSLVLQAGDSVQDGTAPEVRRFLREISPLAGVVPYYPTMGNHDVADRYAADPGQPWARAWSHLPRTGYWYTVSYRDAFFLVLHAFVRGSARDEMLAFARRELARETARPDRRWRVVLFHAGLFTSGKHYADTNQPLRDGDFHRELTAAGVDLVLSGHDHHYERLVVDGRTYVVTGGGGAAMRNLVKRHASSVRAVFRHFHYLAVDVEPSGLRVRARGVPVASGTADWAPALRALDEFTIRR